MATRVKLEKEGSQEGNVVIRFKGFTVLSTYMVLNTHRFWLGKVPLSHEFASYSRSDPSSR